MAQGGLQHPLMPGRQLAFHRGFQGLALVLERAHPAAGEGLGRSPGDKSFDQGTRRDAVDVRGHPAELDTGVVEPFVQTVLLRGEPAPEFGAVARDQRQFAQILGRNEARTQPSKARQGREPLRVGHIGLAPGHVLYMPGMAPQAGRPAPWR
jgi:hypothetical protein